jgi:hypothetical protein
MAAVRRALDDTPARGALLVGLVVVAYAYSFFSLARAAALGSPMAVLALVPVMALVLAWGRLRREPPPPPIHDRQVDYIVGLALFLAALGVAALLPGSRGSAFWLSRLDLLSPPLFTAGLISLFYGVRRAWSLRWPLAVLLLAWPAPWRAFVDAAGTGPLVPVLIVGLLAVGTIAGVLAGSRVRRGIWLAATLLLLATGLALTDPLAAMAGASQSGSAAMAVAPIAVAAGMSVVLGFVLRLRLPRVTGDTILRPASTPSPVRHLGAAPLLAIGLALAMAFVNAGYARYSLVADDLGNPTRSEFRVHVAAPPGWNAEASEMATVARPVVGEDAEMRRYVLVSAAEAQVQSASPVVLDILSTARAEVLVRNPIDFTYWLPWDETTTRRSVDLGGGAIAQLRTFENESLGITRSIIAWDWPVRAGDQVRYERIALIVPDEAMSITFEGAAAGPSDAWAGHSAAERLLIVVARMLVEGDLHADAASSEVQP